MSKDKMTYDQAMKMAMEQMQSGNVEKEVAGVIPFEALELLEALGETQREHHEYHEEMERKIDAYVEFLEAEHKPKCEQLKDKIHDLYQNIFASAGLNAEDFTNMPIEIDVQTGEIRIEKKGPVN